MTIRHNVKRAVYKLSNRGLMVETRIDARGERERIHDVSSWLNILWHHVKLPAVEKRQSQQPRLALPTPTVKRFALVETCKQFF